MPLQDSDLFPIFVRQGKSRTRNKVGYINRAGKTVIDPVFEDGTGFHEGLAAVKVGRVWGAINPAGEFVIRPTLPDSCRFSEGFASVFTKKGWGLINKRGEFIVPPRYRYVGDVREGLAQFITNFEGGYLREGFLNTSGSEVIPAKYNDTGSFSEGLAAVKVANLWGYITHSGTFKIPPRFEGTRQGPVRAEKVRAGHFVGGLAPVWSGTGYGFIDTSGQFVTRADFDMADDFHEGRARIQVEKRVGFVDTDGRMVIEPRFKYAQHFSDGLAAVEEKTDKPYGVYGFIDKEGQTVIPPRFFNTLSFLGGLVPCGNREIHRVHKQVGRFCLGGTLRRVQKYRTVRDGVRAVRAPGGVTRYEYSASLVPTVPPLPPDPPATASCHPPVAPSSTAGRTRRSPALHAAVALCRGRWP